MSAGFTLVDDHEILRFSPDVQSDPELGPPPDLVTQIVVADAGGGRFRPLYWVIRYAEATVLDRHATAWHALYLALGILAAWLFYLALSAANVHGLPALLAGVWLLVVPGVSSVWIRLGPQESLGTLLLLVGALATARGALPHSWPGWDWMFMLSVSAAALTKESFAVVPPAMVALRLLLFSLRQGRRSTLSRRAVAPGVAILGFGLVMTAVAFNTARLSHSGSYGGGFLNAAGVALDDTTWVNLTVLSAAGGVLLPALAIGPILDAWHWRRPTADTRLWLAGAAIVCLLVVPQLVLYRRLGGFTIGRYVLPAGLGIAAAVAAAVVWSRRIGQWWVVVAVTTTWLALLSFDGLVTWEDAESFRADSAQLGRMLDVVDQAPLGSIIAIAADPVRDLEAAVSLPYHLAARGRADLATRVLLTQSDSPDAARMADQFASTYFPGRTDVGARGCAGLAAIILFAPQSRTLEALPCLATDGFHLESFSETVGLGSSVPPIPPELIQPVTVGYSILRR